jgi:hypothetical protein
MSVSFSAVAALAYLMAAVPARADVLLVPGSGSPLVPEDYNLLAPGAVLLAGEIDPFTGGNPNLNGSLQVNVLREVGGTLDFLYAVTNTSPSAAFSHLAVSNFGPSAAVFSTLVGESNVAAGAILPGTTAATSAVRSVSGNVIDFQLGPAGVGLATGDSSLIVFVRTNALDFDDSGEATIIGLGPDTGSDHEVTIEPRRPVPEPSSLSLAAVLSVVLGGFGLLRRCRRPRSTVT